MIESATRARKEEDSGPLQPLCDHTPSHSVTLEPERTDRAERPLSSEYSSLEGQITVYTAAMFLSVVLYLSSFTLLTSVFIFFLFYICVYQLLWLKILPSG